MEDLGQKIEGTKQNRNGCCEGEKRDSSSISSLSRSSSSSFFCKSDKSSSAFSTEAEERKKMELALEEQRSSVPAGKCKLTLYNLYYQQV